MTIRGSSAVPDRADAARARVGPGGSAVQRLRARETRICAVRGMGDVAVASRRRPDIAFQFPNAAISFSRAVWQRFSASRIAGFMRPATVMRPIERRIGVSAEAMAVEIECMVVGGARRTLQTKSS
jgi:hypothetical protein